MAQNNPARRQQGILISRGGTSLPSGFMGLKLPSEASAAPESPTLYSCYQEQSIVKRGPVLMMYVVS